MNYLLILVLGYTVPVAGVLLHMTGVWAPVRWGRILLGLCYSVVIFMAMIGSCTLYLLSCGHHMA